MHLALACDILGGMSKSKKINGDGPATQHDLFLLGGQLTERIDDVSERLDVVTERLDNIEQKMVTKDDAKDFATKDDIQRILTIVESIDDHFKAYKDLPEKVEKLELDVFKLKTRR